MLQNNAKSSFSANSLTLCTSYRYVQNDLFDNIIENENEFHGLNELEKFCFLLTEPDAGDLISEYLNKTFQIRKYLLEKPKQNG